MPMFKKVKVQLIQHAGRDIGMAEADVDKITKMIPDEPDITLEEAIALNPDLTSLAQNDPRVRELVEAAKRLEAPAGFLLATPVPIWGLQFKVNHDLWRVYLEVIDGRFRISAYHQYKDIDGTLIAEETIHENEFADLSDRVLLAVDAVVER